MPIGEIPPSFCWYAPFLYLSSHQQWVHTSTITTKPSQRWDIFLFKNTANRCGTQKARMMRGRDKKPTISATNFSFSPYMTWLLRRVSFFFLVLFAPSLLQNHPTVHFSAPKNSNLRLGPRLAGLGCRFGACLGRISNGVPESSMTRWELKSAKWENDVFFGRFKPSKFWRSTLPKNKVLGLGCG